MYRYKVQNLETHVQIEITGSINACTGIKYMIYKHMYRYKVQYLDRNTYRYKDQNIETHVQV